MFKAIMPTHTVEKLPKSEVKISFEVSWDEAKPYLEQAAKDLSEKNPIQGFRPGKATYDDLKRHLGEMAILETAMERIVRANYVNAVLKENLQTIGSPSIAADQLTPGQTIKFSTISALLPEIKKFPETKDVCIEAKKVEIQDKQIDDAIAEMQKMQRKEVLVDRPATMDDLVILDLEMKQNHVVIEGGSSQNYRVFLAEPHYVPGFAEKMEGVKAGEERNFKLKFPEEHFQKHLAGKEVEFGTKTKGVYELEAPKADDAFAKTLGLASLLELRTKLRENMEVEEKRKAEETAEIEMLEALTDKAEFSEIPELLVQDEVRRMLTELQRGIESQGMDWTSYLASIQKSADELQLEMMPQAVRRIKTALIIKGYADKEEIKPTDEELNKEIDHIIEHLPENDTEARERVASPEYREYVMVQMRNRKTVEKLKAECIKEKTS